MANEREIAVRFEPVVDAVVGGALEQRLRDAQRNLRLVHAQQEEHEKRARHDGRQVREKQQARAAHDLQVKARAEAEAHRTQGRHQRHRDRHARQRGRPAALRALAAADQQRAG
ncbi:MAG: hypothetical protein R2748_02620 [Bryobacterales bacterium]